MPRPHGQLLHHVVVVDFNDFFFAPLLMTCIVFLKFDKTQTQVKLEEAVIEALTYCCMTNGC